MPTISTSIFLRLLFCIACFQLACTQSDMVQREQQTILVLGQAQNIQSEQNAVILHQLNKISDENGMKVDTSTRLEVLEDSILVKYSLLLLLETEVNHLAIWHKNAIERYVQAGNSLLSVHNTQPHPYEWAWYQQLLDKKDAAPINYDGGKVQVIAENFIPEIEQISALIGDNSFNLTKIHTPKAPKSDEFRVKILDTNINEPMEMVILPDSRVLFLERRGLMKLYDPSIDGTRIVAEFDVCTAGNYEDGLHGLALDPDYRNNHFLYLYYSPPCDNPNQILSRFVFQDDSLHLASERQILEVKVQRETCCHSAGSVEFGPDGLLYLSTGDNTISSESDGFSPMDERPSKSYNDAQKSSANTQDLRGKILRIKVEEDGSYSIPEGNLFAQNGSEDLKEGRPEIFVMGCRNPFRFSIDKRNFLYWGDVGPDGGKDGKYGPQSYDEINQAKTAGNFGWPHFTADNKPYRQRSFTTGEAGDFFDPAAPVNLSPNNTGAQQLPPAQPAMIWYPYSESKEFPILGKGSRSSSAGPFYDYDDVYSTSTIKFPKYYDDKLLIYDWARSWLKIVTLDDKGDMLQIEDLLPDLDISKPVDIEYGPNGELYILEYGNFYFLNNKDARLIKIEYSQENRPPTAVITADKLAGTKPLDVQFSAQASLDPDTKDSLRYEWFFTNNDKAESTAMKPNFSFTQNGTYSVRLKVSDPAGATAETTKTIQVGNALPQIEIAVQGNQTFCLDASKIAYQVAISDAEDQEINPKQANFSYAYISSGDYFNDLRLGKEFIPDGSLQYLNGKRLLNESDCRTCHDEIKKSVGPSYQQVAQKYKTEKNAITYLSNKIILGGTGTWGDRQMAAHPQLNSKDAAEMVRYILSLEDNNTLPLEGQLPIKNADIESTEGGLVLAANYQDEGANQIPPLTGKTTRLLRLPKLQAEHADGFKNEWEARFGHGLNDTRIILNHDGYLMYQQIDLTAITQLKVHFQTHKKGVVSLHLDSPSAPAIGSLALSTVHSEEEWVEQDIKMLPVSGIHDFYIKVKNSAKEGNTISIDWVLFQ